MAAQEASSQLVLLSNATHAVQSHGMLRNAPVALLPSPPADPELASSRSSTPLRSAQSALLAMTIEESAPLAFD